MKSSVRFFLGFGLLALFVCYGCGSKPEAEIKAAQEAMDNAKSLHAEEFATADWKEAMIAWEQGQAAVAEGKFAKTYFIRAKSRFEKTAVIAKSNREAVSKEVSDMQTKIDNRFMQIKTAVEKGKVNPAVQKQLKPILAEVDTGTGSIEDLVNKEEFMKARDVARDLQKKLLNVDLIMKGQKPAY